MNKSKPMPIGPEIDGLVAAFDVVKSPKGNEEYVICVIKNKNNEIVAEKRFTSMEALGHFLEIYLKSSFEMAKNNHHIRESICVQQVITAIFGEKGWIEYGQYSTEVIPEWGDIK